MRGTSVALILILALVNPSGAQTPAPQRSVTPTHTTSDWSQVESLNIDQSIAILEHGRRLPLPCRFDRADATFIACNVYAPYSPPRRVVYPIASVEAIYLEEEAYGPTGKAMLVGTGIGAAVAAILCHQADAGIIVTCAAAGGLVGLGIAITPHPEFYPSRPHIRRRLIYRAP